jgi:hypothetical protein
MFRANTDLDDYVCGLSLRRGTGQNLAVPETKSARYRLPALTAGDTGMVRFEIECLPLLAGNFSLTVAFYDQHLQHAYDHLEEVRAFSIVDPEGRGGMVELNGRWSHVVDEGSDAQLPSGVTGWSHK